MRRKIILQNLLTRLQTFSTVPTLGVAALQHQPDHLLRWGQVGIRACLIVQWILKMPYSRMKFTQLVALAVGMAFVVSCAGDEPLERTLFKDDAGNNDMASTSDVSAHPDQSDSSVDMRDDDRDLGLSPDMTSNNGICQPNHDGVIERDEVPLRTGLNAKFRVATDVTFDTTGTMEGGTRVWDLAQTFPGDETVLVELTALQGRWFASEFPEADYATRLSADQDLLGVFEIAENGLFLQGVVSPQDGLTATELTYDPPVATLEFPIREDSVWQTDSDVSGTALGAPVFYDESYVYTPAGRGTLRTPFADFEVMRLRVDLERTQGLLTTNIRSYIFVSECFGTVAVIRSTDNEPDAEFSDVSELRRLAP